MKETGYGRTMLRFYATFQGELLYDADLHEEYNRWLCRYSDEPMEDLTSETDWIVDSSDLKKFLDLPETTVVKKDDAVIDDPALKESYTVAEIESFVVCEDGAIALFKRDDNGKFFCQQRYAWGCGVPQSFWDAMYPDTYARAIAKVEDDFFSEEVPTWYFLGKHHHDLYKVMSGVVVPCIDLYDENGEDATFSNGVLDGLNSDHFHKKDDTHRWPYFDLEALEGTDYAEQKLDTPEKLLLAADHHLSVEWLVREGHQGILTDEEYYCATEALEAQEYHRTHPEVVIA